MNKNQKKQSGKRQRRRSASEWQALIQSHQRSGLNQAAFCRREGISEMSLSNWRKKLSPIAKKRAPSESMASFIELGGALPSPSKALTLRLELGGGMVLTISRSE
jgi:transposase-like protein